MDISFGTVHCDRDMNGDGSILASGRRSGADTSSWLFSLLSVVLTTWYVCVVVGLAVVIGIWPSRPLTSFGQIPWWSVPAALIVVAATWSRVRRYVSTSVHHLVFGQHDDAYRVVERVYHHLHGDPRPEQLLPTLAATLADTMRLPYVAIETSRGEQTGWTGRPQTAVHGVVPEHVELVTIPLRYHHLTLGTLRVSTRRRLDRLSAADLRLLDDLSRHVAIALYAAQVSDALQTSRELLVTAREEERRRIRRDLHDGLGPTLASLRLQLGALRRTLRSDPDEAERLVGTLGEDVGEATAGIRRLIHGLRPPMLDEFGLIGALQNLEPVEPTVVRSVVSLTDLPPLPAAVEVAMYRIASEALHNTMRHANATRCTIVLAAAAGDVTLQVTDDGCGLPRDYRAGVGHMSMHERATELGGKVEIADLPGGGTTVTAVLPVMAPHA